MSVLFINVSVELAVYDVLVKFLSNHININQAYSWQAFVECLLKGVAMEKFSHLHVVVSGPYLFDRFHGAGSASGVFRMYLALNELERVGCAVMVALTLWSIYAAIKAAARMIRHRMRGRLTWAKRVPKLELPPQPRRAVAKKKGARIPRASRSQRKTVRPDDGADKEVEKR